MLSDVTDDVAPADMEKGTFSNFNHFFSYKDILIMTCNTETKMWTEIDVF